MAIVQSAKKPDVPCYEPGDAPPPGAVLIKPEVFRGITIDCEYAPPTNLMAWSSGSNWIVDYWSQILRADQEPTVQNLAREPHAQQYRWLHDIPLKVNQGLQDTTDDTINTWSRTGSGHVYGFMTPNVGDMFAAAIGNGRTGLFTITSARRVTIQAGSTFEVEWKQVSELSENQYNDLKRKSIEEYWFDGNSANSGCGPFLSTEQKKRGQDYRKMLKALVSNYITDFYSQDNGTFLVPDQIYKTYDHFVTKAFLTMVDSNMDNRIWRIKVLNVMSEPVMKQPTFWDAVLYQDMGKIATSMEHAHLVSTNISRWKPELQAIGYTGIGRFVFPVEASTAVDAQYDGENLILPWGIPFEPGQPMRPIFPPVSQLLRNEEWFQRTPPEKESLFIGKEYLVPAVIHPVVQDTYYVLSEAFYRCQPRLQSRLEMLATAMLRGDEINKKQFDSVLETVRYWDNLERFYYHPLVIALLKYSMR